MNKKQQFKVTVIETDNTQEAADALKAYLGTDFTNEPEYRYWHVDGSRPGGVYHRSLVGDDSIQHMWYRDGGGYWGVPVNTFKLDYYVNQGFVVRRVAQKDLPADVRP